MYTEEQGAVSSRWVTDGSTDIDALTGTGVHTSSILVLRPVTIRRVYAAITTATVSSADIVVAVKKRGTFGSTSGETTIATLNIPTAKAAGVVMYKSFDAVNCAAGDQIVFEVTTAAAGGGAAGNCIYGAEMNDDPEVPANSSDLTASS